MSYTESTLFPELAIPISRYSHDKGDLHAVGDALAPPVVVSNVGTVASIGTSDRVAREDHVHGNSLEAWQTPSLSANWVNFGSGYSPAGFRRQGNCVYLRGLVKKAIAASSGEVLFTLPVGYRPTDGVHMYQVPTVDPTGFIARSLRIDVHPGGGVLVNYDSATSNAAGFTCLDGIFFFID